MTMMLLDRAAPIVDDATRRQSSSSPPSRAGGEQIMDVPTFTRLPAAAAGQVVEIDRGFTATSHPFNAAYARYLVE